MIKWTLVGSDADKWFGNIEPILCDSKEELKEIFRSCVEGDWSNVPDMGKEEKIAQLWEEFDHLATAVTVCDACGYYSEHYSDKVQTTKFGKHVCGYMCLDILYGGKVPEVEDIV